MIEPTLAGDVAGLVTRAIDLSSQLDADVEEIVRRAAEQPLSDADARRLFERILTVLVAHRGGEIPPAEVGERVRSEVDLVMAGRAARLLEANGSAVRTHVELFP